MNQLTNESIMNQILTLLETEAEFMVHSDRMGCHELSGSFQMQGHTIKFNINAFNTDLDAFAALTDSSASCDAIDDTMIELGRAMSSILADDDAYEFVRDRCLVLDSDYEAININNL